MIANLGIAFHQGYKDCIEMSWEDFLSLHKLAIKVNKENQ